MNHPQGTITLVFTDIQGSTKLWDSLGNTFETILETHNTLIRNTLKEHNGYEVKTEGDSFMIAFQQANDATQFALSVQEKLQQHDWPEESGEILVRIGLHTGSVITRENEQKQIDYFGPTVNLAARISSAAHGGQIILSNSTYILSQHNLAQVDVKNLGEHRFKGIEKTELIHQISPLSLANRTFPPIKSIDTKKTNLQKNPSSFIGRENEILNLNHSFHSKNKRLVTITGPGGTGKTRLSQAWSAVSIGDFPAGVWLADISNARSKDEVCCDLAHALNIPLTSLDPVTQIGHCLDGLCRSSNGAVLILLDNCEQVIDDVADVVKQWLNLCPDVKFLLTSRITLNIDDEVELPLKHLSTPTLKDIEEQRNLSSFISVQLFIKRSQEINPQLQIKDNDLQDIARICYKLDGIPLCIELAASRSKILSPKKLLERLEDRFDILKSSRRDISQRHSTLRKTIDWGWELLSDYEQSTLSQLSVFSGGFLLEAAEKVVDLNNFDDAPMVMDVIQSLREKSFLNVTELQQFNQESFFSTYQMIREYAAEKLNDMQLTQTTQKRWENWLFDYGKQWWEEYEKKGHDEARQRLKQIHDELISLTQNPHVSKERSSWATIFTYPILHQQGPVHLIKPMIYDCLKRFNISEEDLNDQYTIDSTNTAQIEIIHRLILQLSHYYLNSEPTTAETLASIIPHDSPVFADALFLSGVSYRKRVKSHEALKYYLQALPIYQENKNQNKEACTLEKIASVYYMQDKTKLSLDYLDQAMGIYQKIDNQEGQTAVLFSQSNIHLNNKDFVMATDYFNQALIISRKIENSLLETSILSRLGFTYWTQNDSNKALDIFNQSLKIAQRLGNRIDEAMLLGNIGYVYVEKILDAQEKETTDISLKNARNNLEQSINTRKQLDIPRYLGFEIALSRCHLALNNNEKAKTLIVNVTKEIKRHQKNGTNDGIKKKDLAIFNKLIIDNPWLI